MFPKDLIYKSKCIDKFQSKVHGHHGILGPLALELVTVTQNGIEPGASLEATYLAQETLLRKEAAQVCH